MKTCTKCHQTKQLEEFLSDKSRKDGHKSWCKQCWRDYYKAHKENFHRTYRKRYLANTVEFLKNNANRKYKHRYGITTEKKEKMILEQEGKCLICNKFFKDSKDQCVDHDHRTKRVRAILCNDCNKGIGAFKDNPDILVAAAKYLLSFKNDPQD